MPTTIKLKNSVTTTNTPSSLAQGEVAINITDKKVWVGNAATTPVQLLGAGASGTFGALTCTSLTNLGLTSGRVTYASTGGLLADSANFTFNGTTVTMANDASISGLTVGKGGGAQSTNTAVGSSSMAGTNTGGYTTAVGYAALQSNTSGRNTAFGALAAAQTTTGTLNTSIGDSSLYNNTTGGYNVAVGQSALLSNTTASNNTAVGYQAGYNNTTGASLVALGFQAGYSNTTATDNTFIGKSAALWVTGGYNTALGSNALAGVGGSSTGTNNTALGYASLFSNTTASNNTAVGYQALYSNTTNSGNAALGPQALYSTTTGGANVAFGQQAGYSNTTGNYSAFIGHQAGYSATTGGQNTFIGRNAGYNVSTGSKNTILGSYDGNQNSLDIRTLSNNIVLSDGDGNPRSFYVSDAWYWRTAGVERMRISDTGYLKVSDNASYLNAAGSYHEVNQTAANSSLVVRNSNASFTQDVIQARPVRNTTNGTFTAFLYYNETAATARFQVLDSGNVQNTNNSYGAISDIKLKENIVDATPKLEKLMDVKVRNYNLKSDQTHKQIGFIAQELEQVFPALVEEFADKDGDGKDLGTTTKAIKYSVFVPILVKAIQELKAEVDSLKAQLNK